MVIGMDSINGMPIEKLPHSLSTTNHGTTASGPARTCNMVTSMVCPHGCSLLAATPDYQPCSYTSRRTERGMSSVTSQPPRGSTSWSRSSNTRSTPS